MFNKLKKSPSTIKIALVGYVVNISVPLIFAVTELFNSYDSDDFGVSLILVCLVYGFAIWLGEHIFNAKNWARLTHAIIGLLVIIIILIGCFSSQEMAVEILDIISIIISIAVIVLTYTPSANDWYRSSKNNK